MEPQLFTAEQRAALLAALAVPFHPSAVQWRVAATSRDKKKGRVVAYADKRAYTDRLNAVCTSSGWSEELSVTTISPVKRTKKDVAIETGKIMVACTVTIAGIGSHTSSGEGWADDDNAMTRAEAQAFRRACSEFGLGRYFYNFAEMWVDLNQYGEPVKLPSLPAWALPPAAKKAPAQANHPSDTRTTIVLPSEITDPKLKARIAGYSRVLGPALYENIVRGATNAFKQGQRTGDLAAYLLHFLDLGARGLDAARSLAEQLASDRVVRSILGQHGVAQLDRIPTLNTLKALNASLQQAVAATRGSAA